MWCGVFCVIVAVHYAPFTLMNVQRFHALPRIHVLSFFAETRTLLAARRNSPRTDCVHAAAERVHYELNVKCMWTTRATADRLRS